MGSGFWYTMCHRRHADIIAVISYFYSEKTGSGPDIHTVCKQMPNRLVHYTVASAPTVGRARVVMRRIGLFLGQCVYLTLADLLPWQAQALTVHSAVTPTVNIRGQISSLRVYSICNYACNLNLANCCVHTYHQKKISYKINITKLLYLTAKNTGLIVNISFPWSHVLRSRPFVGSVGRSPHFGGSGSRKRT